MLKGEKNGGGEISYDSYEAVVYWNIGSNSSLLNRIQSRERGKHIYKEIVSAAFDTWSWLESNTQKTHKVSWKSLLAKHCQQLKEAEGVQDVNIFVLSVFYRQESGWDTSTQKGNFPMPFPRKYVWKMMEKEWLPRL